VILAILKKAVDYTKNLQAKVDALTKDKHKAAPYDFVYEVQQEAGKPDRVTRKVIRKPKQEESAPIV
jgi:hypothetical protein